jgi:hypothetical protein
MSIGIERMQNKRDTRVYRRLWLCLNFTVVTERVVVRRNSRCCSHGINSGKLIRFEISPIIVVDDDIHLWSINGLEWNTRTKSKFVRTTSIRFARCSPWHWRSSIGNHRQSYDYSMYRHERSKICHQQINHLLDASHPRQRCSMNCFRWANAWAGHLLSNSFISNVGRYQSMWHLLFAVSKSICFVFVYLFQPIRPIVVERAESIGLFSVLLSMDLWLLVMRTKIVPCQTDSLSIWPTIARIASSNERIGNDDRCKNPVRCLDWLVNDNYWHLKDRACVSRQFRREISSCRSHLVDYQWMKTIQLVGVNPIVSLQYQNDSTVDKHNSHWWKVELMSAPALSRITVCELNMCVCVCVTDGIYNEYLARFDMVHSRSVLCGIHC